MHTLATVEAALGPAPVGYLHKGTPQNPYGGGHFCVAIGYDSTGFYMNDPYGSCDLLNGGFTQQGGNSGKLVHYSYKNWMPRWSVANDSYGWGLDIWLPGKSYHATGRACPPRITRRCEQASLATKA